VTATPGEDFGIAVPALVVCVEGGDRPTDVFSTPEIHTVTAFPERQARKAAAVVPNLIKRALNPGRLR